MLTELTCAETIRHHGYHMVGTGGLPGSLPAFLLYPLFLYSPFPQKEVGGPLRLMEPWFS